jgi:5-amino-6-(5-phospho-D-ribitylamino)uracil phosphatase
MFRVIATDLDGTLLRSDGSISPRTRAVLDRCMADGMEFMIAAGRAKASAASVLPPDFHRGIWACCNGADIYEDGVLIAQNGIAPDLAREINACIRRLFPKANVYAVVGGELYFTESTTVAVPYRVAGDLDSVMTEPVGKIAFHLSEVPDVELLRSSLPDDCRFILTVGARIGEIMAPTATKAWAVESVVKRWGLDLSDVIAFGDETNDIEMIAECGLGVAMTNSHPDLLAVADRIAPSNDEDGVAQVLESLVLEACPRS